ncbi:squalene synthase isoform X5 [Esox lucius]|uniref:squalene synthase isoform X5 n=1 Tax=Esox lucius TaxID=8010 RepID=UPI0009732184|nr:squalene synthase isoform X5 [Esox lucius]
MAGTCFKCPVSLTVFKRSFCVTPRSGPASRTFFYGGRLGEKGVQEGCWAARPTALRTVGSFRFPAYFCFSCQESMSESLRTCYLYLNQTSRSFAAVIQALDGELRHAVCIFYLVLRALDTVEDDMTIPFEKKVPMLNDFHTYLYQADWCFTESHERDKQVLEDFATISLEFRNLGQEYQDVISDICQRMGVGMAEFLEKKVGSMKEWDQYCHYVAGLVGIGLSQLFSASQLEDPEVGRDTELANSMGLFLQKTNIIRDYLEDIQVARAFWPQEVMAIATLSACYNNPQVFQGVVKIRKGQAVTLMMQATNMAAVQSIMAQYSQKMLHRVSLTDPSRDKTLRILRVIQERTVSQTTLPSRTTHLSPIYLSAAMLIAALSWQYLSTGQPEGNTDMQGH